MWWVPTQAPLLGGLPHSDQLLIPYPIASPPTQHKLPRLPHSAQPVPTSGARGYLHRGQHSHQRPCVSVPTQLLQHLVGFERRDPCEQV